MKNLLFYFFYIVLILSLSCKKESNSIKENGILDSTKENLITKKNESEIKIPKEILDEKPKSLDTLKQWSLPLGKKTILTNFPKKWQFESPEDNKYESILNSVYTYTDSLLYYTKFLIAKDSSNCQTFPANKYYRYYDDYVYYNNKYHIKKAKSVHIARLANKNFKKDLVLEIEVNLSGASFINIKTIDEKKNEIDGLNLGYKKNVYTFTHSGKYFFIDKNMIIHIKHFLSIDNETLMNYYEKFQILSSGKIVRYFDSNGEFKSDSEIGKTENNTQVGKWTEIKHNNYVEQTTYLIANYKEGNPIGTWQYFNIINNTEKGSKLLMTEEYSNDGELLKRELFQND